jgi:hypothetical protein
MTGAAAAAAVPAAAGGVDVALIACTC